MCATILSVRHIFPVFCYFELYVVYAEHKCSYICQLYTSAFKCNLLTYKIFTCFEQDGLAALKNRSISFAGKFEAVKWKCRAPMPNGKFCERMDRFKVRL